MGNLGRRGVDPENLLSLQLLFAKPLKLDAASLTRALRAYDEPLANARVEVEELPRDGARLALISWGEHAVEWVGFDAPMPSEAVEACVQPAHYAAELKARARAHRSHVLLYYAGTAPNLLERFVALAAVAGALAPDAIVVLNAAGHTSIPAEALETQGPGMLELLRSMPLPMLYVGFVKLEVEGVPGVWMRTYGAHLLGLPNLAYHAASHAEGQSTFELFSNVLAYLLSSGATFEEGHTLEAGAGLMRLRGPRPDEDFLRGKGSLFVLEKAPKGSPALH